MSAPDFCSVAVAMMLILPAAAYGAEPVSTRIFNPSFASLRISVGGDDQALPVVRLADPDGPRLEISFDELTHERSYLRCRLVHCDASWVPDGLVESEYVDGFNEAVIDDYRFSRATLTHYVHYTVTIPSDDLRPLVSGNYLLQVYDEDTPDVTVLQACFSVSESTMRVSSAYVTSRTDIDYNATHQQLSLAVDIDRVILRDIHNDLRVVVEQNGRPDSRRTVVNPLRVEGSVAVFDHNPSLIFDAGNEYRRFETVSTSYPSMGVERIVRTGDLYHMALYPDLPRADTRYVYDQTQHGRFRIREYNSDDSDTEADYAYVHFALEMPETADGDIFIDGDLTGRRFDPSSLMVYNRASGCYEQSMLLKQGAYNYQYLFVPHGSMAGVTSVVEGDYYPTVNEYDIRVYYRAPGERYDRLAAVATVFSGP